MTLAFSRRLGVFVAILSILAVACGGTQVPAGGAQAPAGPSAVATGGAATAAPAAAKITIATLQPLSGPFASVGQLALEGVQLAVKHINDAGGIKALGGAKFELITADSTSTDQTAAASVTNQLLQKNPVAIIGPSSSNVHLAATTEAERAQVPICGMPYADAISQRGYKYMFQMPQTGTVVGQQVVPALESFLVKLSPDIRNIAVINDDSAGIVALNKGLIDAIGKSGKYKVVYHQQYPLELTNAAPLAAGIKQSGAQLVISGGQIPNILLIAKALKEQGLSHLPVFNPGGGAIMTPAYSTALGEFVNGQFAQNLWAFDMKLSTEQNALLERIDRDYRASSKAPFTDAFVGVGYVCTALIAEAMERGRTSKPAEIASVLHRETFSSGAASLWPGGSVKFNDAGLNVNAVTLVGEWCNGVLRTIYPLSMAAMEPKLPKDCGAPK